MDAVFRHLSELEGGLVGVSCDSHDSYQPVFDEMESLECTPVINKYNRLFSVKDAAEAVVQQIWRLQSLLSPQPPRVLL